MSQIINKINTVNSDDSEAVKEAVTTLVKNLPKHSHENCYTWLLTLHDVINKFPKYCLSHRSAIESHITQFLDSNSLHNTIVAAKCGHSLQQVRPSQEKTATPKTCWREQMSMLCEAAHSLITAIFTEAVEPFKHANNTQNKETEASLFNTPFSTTLLEITKVKNTSSSHNDGFDVQDKHNLLCTRLKNVFIFIQAMLIEPYPVGKPVRPSTVLDVIVRALTLSSGAVNNLTSQEDIATIKTQALRTLDALVHCLGPNLVPFSPLVFRLAMQTLRWSSEQTSEQSRKVRSQAYGSLVTWLGALRCHKLEASRGRCLEDELVQNVIRDVTPTKHVVQLTINAQPSKHMSKKAKRKLANSMLQSSAIANHIPGEKSKPTGPESMDEELKVSALECLESFLIVCGTFLKPTNHKIIQERLVRECFAWSAHSAHSSLLYCRALEAARKNSGPHAPPPTQYCLLLYSQLANCGRRQISEFCTRALLDIRMHLHCSPPSINYSLAEPTDKPGDETNKKFISERNRAALEALLGPDKVPNNSNDEIITISDEPANKKSRVEEEEVKNISISDDTDVEEVECDVNGEPTTSDTDEPIVIDEIDMKEDESQSTSLNASSIQIADITQKHINEADTQIPAISYDTTDGRDSSHSIEVEYDYPNASKNNVPTLDKLDGDNLPCTNETDDIQITCGQKIKSSHDDKEDCLDNKENEPKVNGTITLVDTKVANCDVDDKKAEPVSIKTNGNDAVTVEDMLADFVDEVNDEPLEA